MTAVLPDAAAPTETPSPTENPDPAEASAAAWIARQTFSVRQSLEALGKLLSGLPMPAEPLTADRFARDALGIPESTWAAEESIELGGGVARATTGVVVADLIDEFDPAIGPGDGTAAPSWTLLDLGDDDSVRIPSSLAAAFPAGTLHAEHSVVVRVVSSGSYKQLEVLSHPAHPDVAKQALSEVRSRRRARNPYRGKVVLASMAAMGGLTLQVLPKLTATRGDLVIGEKLWQEIDLNVSAVSDGHHRLAEAGLGARRSVILAGPPGTGKSMLAGVVAGELNRSAENFTVIYVDARAGERLLRAVMETAAKLQPSVVVLEDMDLYVRDRRVNGGGGLSELLYALEVAPEARILTISTTNDPRVLDAAALRAGRTDAVLEVGTPDRTASVKLLRTFLRDVPGGAEVDVEAVAATLPAKITGAEIREIVRRAVLMEAVGTVGLIGIAKAGAWKPKLPAHSTGHYL